MSSAQIKRFEQWRAAVGRPVAKLPNHRERAAKLREHAARLLSDASEEEAMADYLNEPELKR